MTIPNYDLANEYLVAHAELNFFGPFHGREVVNRFDEALKNWCHEVDNAYVSSDDTHDDLIAHVVTDVVPVLRAWLASDDHTELEHDELVKRTRVVLGDS